MGPDPALLTIVDARRALEHRELSAVELTDSVLSRIELMDRDLHAYLHVDAEDARSQARALERRDGDLPLRGIPICVKDVIDVAGAPTTAGSANWRREPARDAAAVARLRAAGAVIVGKGHTNEFAYGIDGRNPHFGDCRNPYDRTRLTGGSSSGPAVATAAGMALAGLGTDTSGSIRVPASFCGLVGIRPTVGLVPTSGVVPLAWSYDTVGPLARTVADAGILFDVLAGGTPHGTRREAGDVRGLRIGVIEQLLEGVEPYVESAVRQAADQLEAAGAELSAVRFELLSHANAIHQLVQHAEASQVHAASFAEQYQHYSESVRLRLSVGLLLPASAYLRAQRARRLLIDEFADRTRAIDALLAPSTPCSAPAQDSREITVGGVALELRQALLQCVLAPSQFGCPVVAVPIGTHQGLPFGMQIIGRPYTEHSLLSIAAACERPATSPVAG